jgi:hypothetical protein
MRLPGSRRLRGVTGFIKMPGPKDDPKSSEWRPYIFARDQWHCRNVPDRSSIRGRGDDYGRDYSGFTNLWYTFEYRCQDGTRPALDMDSTKGRLEVEQVE